MKEMRKQILMYMETNSRVDLGELAVTLGTDEADVANEIARMEKEEIICGYHTLIDWDKTITFRKIAPRCPTTCKPYNSIHNDTIVFPWTSLFSSIFRR